MNKIIKIIFILLLICGVLTIVMYFLSPSGYWLCINGEWVKSGNPKTPQPTASCSKIINRTTNPLLPIIQDSLNKNTNKPSTDQKDASTNLANPASVFCVEQGGKSEIVTQKDGSQSGLCAFPNGPTCDEWEFFRTKTCKNK